MIIWAVDPGTEESAVIQWNTIGNTILYRYILPNDGLLSFFRYKRPVYDNQDFVIEGIRHYGTGMPIGKSVIETCYFIGRLIEALYPHPAHIIYRPEIKIELCGSARAKDANIRQALIDRFGEPGTKKKPGKLYGVKSHLWSALAVAIAWDQMQNRHSTTPRVEVEIAG